MRKAYGRVWWYRLRCGGVARSTLVAIALVTATVGIEIEKNHWYATTAPVCGRVTAAPSGARPPQWAPPGERGSPRISPCREGWVDARAHAEDGAAAAR